MNKNDEKAVMNNAQGNATGVMSSDASLANQLKTGPRRRQERRPITLYLRPGVPAERDIITGYLNHSQGQEYLRNLIIAGYSKTMEAQADAASEEKGEDDAE